MAGNYRRNMSRRGSAKAWNRSAGKVHKSNKARTKPYGGRRR